MATTRRQNVSMKRRFIDISCHPQDLCSKAPHEDNRSFVNVSRRSPASLQDAKCPELRRFQALKVLQGGILVQFDKRPLSIVSIRGSGVLAPAPGGEMLSVRGIGLAGAGGTGGLDIAAGAIGTVFEMAAKRGGALRRHQCRLITRICRAVRRSRGLFCVIFTALRDHLRRSKLRSIAGRSVVSHFFVVSVSKSMAYWL